MYQKILQDPLVFGDEIGSQARSILASLLTREPSQRLGVNGADEIKRHPFFAKNIDFRRLLNKEIQPPFKPSVSSPVVRVYLCRFFIMLFAAPLDRRGGGGNDRWFDGLLIIGFWCL